MHEQKRTLTVDLLFPDHHTRLESPEHRKVREVLIVRERFPCWICGRTIDDFGGDAQHLEIHHLYAEYAEFDDIDPARVRADHPLFAAYNSVSAKYGDYLDADSLVGSLVLCDLHHRGATTPGRCLAEGIHSSDFDSWEMQKYLKDEDLDRYFPGVVVLRKGVSDAQGYLPAYIATRYDKQPLRACPKPVSAKAAKAAKAAAAAASPEDVAPVPPIASAAPAPKPRRAAKPRK